MKLINLKDDTYKRLKRIKTNLGLSSFNNTIEYLLNIYDTYGTKAKIINLKNSINIIDEAKYNRIFHDSSRY
jgi:hypothetical protein